MSVFDVEDLKYSQASVDTRKCFINTLRMKCELASKRCNDLKRGRDIIPNKIDDTLLYDCINRTFAYSENYEFNDHIKGELKYTQLDIDVLDKEIDRLLNKYVIYLNALKANRFDIVIKHQRFNHYKRFY